MPKRISTARGREFGAGLRAAMTAAGLTARAVAEIVEWDEAKLSDVVTGKGGASRVEIAALLGVCRVGAVEARHLLALYPEAHVRGWWQQHGTCAPVLLRTVAEHLAVTETLISWHTHMVPFFLQTADYMREVLSGSATTPVGELEDRVMALLALQESLRGGVKSTYFIHELALYLRVGGTEVYVGQLLHLLHMANWLNVTIRIVPAALGAHAGLAGPFTHLSFAKYESMVWVETENSSLFAEAKDAITGYENVIHALDRDSLNEADSKELIVRLCDSSRAAEGETTATGAPSCVTGLA